LLTGRIPPAIVQIDSSHSKPRPRRPHMIMNIEGVLQRFNSSGLVVELNLMENLQEPLQHLMVVKKPPLALRQLMHKRELSLQQKGQESISIRAVNCLSLIMPQQCLGSAFALA
jgi:hypothetical protein